MNILHHNLSIYCCTGLVRWWFIFLFCKFKKEKSQCEKSTFLFTGLAGSAPSSGHTCGSRWDAGAGGSQTHRRDARCHLSGGCQLQESDVIVEVLAVVVGVSDGLNGGVGENKSLTCSNWKIQIVTYEGYSYLGNIHDLNLLTVVLTVMLSQDNTMASWTEVNTKRQDWS